MPTSNPPPLRSILESALPVAREAAALLLEGWRGAPRIRTKAKGDLVTDYDERAEALIRERLTHLFPSHSVIGEEGGGQSADLVWYVDPIDGTTNFAHGHPFFCTAMALCEGNEPLVGVVIAPAIGIEWAAVRGGGVTRNGQTCRVSDCEVIDDALMSTGFPAWRASRPDNNYRPFLALDSASRGVRRCGAAAMEIAMVADGSYDAFWDLGLKPWDVAAGTLFVREAGGIVSDFEGGPAHLEAGRILASNPHLHPVLARSIAGLPPLPPISGLPAGT